MPRAPAPNPTGPSSITLWWTLAALVLARALLAFVPWMGLWGLSVQRFLSPLAAWLPWALAAAALAAPLARIALPAWERCGETLRVRPTLALVTAGVLAAALVWLLPDRVRWVGDSLLRLGGVKIERPPELLSPQALPLDIWLHYKLPQMLVARHWLDPDAAVRSLGAIEAGLFAALAGAFALGLETTAAGRAAAMATAFFGGSLCLMTGESKAFAEVVLAVMAAGALGIQALRGHRWALPALGAVVSVAALAHRQALGLLPALLLLCAVRLATSRREGAPAWPAWIALALPAIVLIALAGKLWRTLAGYDLPRNFLPAGGGGLGPLFSATRMLDLASALLMLAPLCPLILLLWPAPRTLRAADAPTTRNEWTFLLVLAGPFLLAALLARPPQGLIRDWDGLGAAGAALSLLAAWLVARWLRTGSRSWLAVPVTLVAATSALAWLLHFHDPARAIARVEALLHEPPARPPAERSRSWEFVAWHQYQREQWDAAATAFDSASALGPSPRMLAQWAMAETMRKNYPQARALYQRAVERDSNLTVGWTGVAVAAIWYEDLAECERAARQLQRLAPNDPKTREILAYLAQAKRTQASAHP
jgi:hypothetical protein